MSAFSTNLLSYNRFYFNNSTEIPTENKMKFIPGMNTEPIDP